MAENLTIARPYAEAAYACAKENNCISSWETMLQGMALACSDEVFLSALKNSASPESASTLLCNLLSQGEVNLLNEYGQNFISLLSENGRFEAVPEVYSEFVRLKEKDQKIVEAEVVSARPLDPGYLKQIADKIESRYGCKAKISTKIDPGIIGGAILKIGDEVIDASVKTSLESLSSTLK